MEIVRGRVLSQRFFDIAEEIDLGRAEALVRELSRRPKFVGSARHIELPNPPLEMALGNRGQRIAGFAVNDIMVRLYDVGALVVSFIIDIANNTPADALINMSRTLSEAEDTITDAARPIALEIATAIRGACKISELMSDITEDYTIFCLQQTRPASTAATLSEHLDVPLLLVADTGALAEQERRRLTQAAFSYRPDDWVVVEWNSALVLDPTGAQEVPELLELTVMQMLELRIYDNIVGKALEKVYAELDQKQGRLFGNSNYTGLSHRIMQLFVDVIEITERIDNSLTFLGDTWLARVHGAAATEFGIPRWQKQLRQKLELLRQINALLADQIKSQKSYRIEWMIVILIMIETILALLRHGH